MDDNETLKDIKEGEYQNILNQTDEYFLKDMIPMSNTMICLVKPREQHFFKTKETKR